MNLKIWFLALIFSFTAVSSHAANNVIANIKQRQFVVCGIDSEYKSLAYRQDNVWRGLDADICRAVAAAVLDNTESFKLLPVKKDQIGKLLNSGTIDLMLGQSTLSAGDEANLYVLPADLLYFDRQIFASRKTQNAKSMRDFSSLKVCVLRNSPAASFLHEYNQKYALGFNILEMPTTTSVKEGFYLNRCELISGGEIFVKDVVNNLRSNEPAQVLPEEIAYLPVKAYTAANAPSFNIVLRWIINALKLASAADINQQNVSAFNATKNTSLQNLLGLKPDAWKKLGLEPDWVKKYITAYGNYQQILERNVGLKSNLSLEFKQNEPIEKGGFLSYQPFF